MLIKVASVAFSGINTIKIDVEVNVADNGLPAFDIVGLPNKAVAESRERVKTALINSGISFPLKRITVNLAPADVPKEGAFYDLPIAVGIISAVTGFRIPENSIYFGELSLDGSLRHTRGTLLAALFAEENSFSGIYIPEASSNEAAVTEGPDIFPVSSIAALIEHLNGSRKIKPQKDKFTFSRPAYSADFDMSEIAGQETAKRALEIAAAGGHNILMTGSPGSGKTMLARSLPGILPELTPEESIEVTKIYSSAGIIPPGGTLITERPFRAPHHIISQAGLVGGGTRPRPGEISLAHKGVLFLDEFNEFPRNVIESLRQPLEDGYLTISRSRDSVTYPARFTLAAAANPCPCGNLNDEFRQCNCSPGDIARYRRKLSGPILDRIDLHVDVPAVKISTLSLSNRTKDNTEKSEAVRERVESARKIQRRRFRDSGLSTNAEMKNNLVKSHAKMDRAAEKLLNEAADRFKLSARSYLKIIRISRTIADLDSSERIMSNHTAEALQYRRDENR